MERDNRWKLERVLPMLLCLLALWWPAQAQPPSVVRVGSKSFTESYILGEIIAQIIAQVGEAQPQRTLGLGGTGITYRALATGNIDIYPEYTGTLSRAILKDPTVHTVAAIRQRLQPQGLSVSDPLGFNNTYALAIRQDVATRLKIHRISDLAHHPELTAAFSSGFLQRDDGWPGLRRTYGLRFADVRTMEHTLTYEALINGKIDVMDIFSTDGKIPKLNLYTLHDDRQFFPAYHAVLFVRQEFIERFPRTWEALQHRLVGQIDNPTMLAMNARAESDGESFGAISAAFLGIPAGTVDERADFLRQLGTLTLDHLYLVAFSLAVAMLLGIPLGIFAARFRRLGQMEMMSIGVLQTVPALALLSFMIPFFGIGKLPTLVALCLYALLPIVRNTYTGMVGLDAQLLDIAGVLGLNRWQRLLRIELPLASLHIMAGIKTSAVLTVGTATLAAFIGGGGYGTLIVTGLALDDIATILAGAIPSALMALAVQGLFELLDRLVIPKGLQQGMA
jgi:osmoprotectant transport system permease protein